MKKHKPKTTQPRAQRASRAPCERCRTMAAAGSLESAFDLDLVAQLAAPYAEEAEAIEHVIRCVRELRCGRPVQIRLADVLLALSILLSAIERDLTREERELLATLERSLRRHTRAGLVCLPDLAADLPLAIAARRRAACASCPPISTPTHATRIAA